jgi:hypothetical protein
MMAMNRSESYQYYTNGNLTQFTDRDLPRMLELKQPAQAMIEFEATLRTAPNRFNALSCATRAAKLSGDQEKAKTYYAKLLAICQHADGDRPELRDARSLLAQK